MQEAAASIGVGLASVLVVILVLLSACLIALAPLRRIRLPFTVAVMLLGSIVGIAVETLERYGFGLGSGAVLQHVEAPLSGNIDSLQDEASTGGHSVESRTDDHNAGHTSLFRRFIDEFVSVFRAAGDGLTPTLILFVFLPILVFESAYNLEARQVIRNFLPITVLALPGVLLSTVICGVAVMMAGGPGLGITWAVALLFGVIVSATDPVAVVGLFKKASSMTAPPLSYSTFSLRLSSVRRQPGQARPPRFFQEAWSFSRSPSGGRWWGCCWPGSAGASSARSLRTCPSKYPSPSLWHTHLS